MAGLVSVELPRLDGDGGMAALPLLLLRLRESEGKRERVQMRERSEAGAVEQPMWPTGRCRDAAWLPRGSCGLPATPRRCWRHAGARASGEEGGRRGRAGFCQLAESEALAR